MGILKPIAGFWALWLPGPGRGGGILTHPSGDFPQLGLLRVQLRTLGGIHSRMGICKYAE